MEDVGSRDVMAAVFFANIAVLVFAYGFRRIAQNENDLPAYAVVATAALFSLWALWMDTPFLNLLTDALFASYLTACFVYGAFSAYRRQWHLIGVASLLLPVAFIGVSILPV